MINKKFSPAIMWPVYTLLSFIAGKIIFLAIGLYLHKRPSFFIVFATVLLSLTIIREWYTRTIFELQANGVQFEHNFITFSQKNIRYSDIKQITLQRNIIQRIFGLGTIRVTTHATSKNADITFYDIKNYQEVYDVLLEKIKC